MINNKIDWVFPFLLLFITYIIIKLIPTGYFTGNEYKKIDGKIWVKHKGSDVWDLLSQHQEEQKRLRDNK